MNFTLHFQLCDDYIHRKVDIIQDAEKLIHLLETHTEISIFIVLISSPTPSFGEKVLSSMTTSLVECDMCEKRFINI